MHLRLDSLPSDKVNDSLSTLQHLTLHLTRPLSLAGLQSSSFRGSTCSLGFDVDKAQHTSQFTPLLALTLSDLKLYAAAAGPLLPLSSFRELTETLLLEGELCSSGVCGTAAPLYVCPLLSTPRMELRAVT